MPGGGVYALLLTPKARVIADLEMFNTGDELVLAARPLAGTWRWPRCASRFRRKVDLEPSGHVVVWGEAAGALAALPTPAGPHVLLAGAPAGIRQRGGLGGGPGGGRASPPSAASSTATRCQPKPGLTLRGQLHQGLLPGAGAGRPAALPGACQPRPARAGAGGRACRGRLADRLRPARGRPGDVLRAVPPVRPDLAGGGAPRGC